MKKESEIQYTTGKYIMNKEKLLKLVSETEGITSFKILKTETTSCKIQQICQIKKGTVHFKYRSCLEANIYKSEIGKPYIEVKNDEAGQLRLQLQKKMLEDFQLLVKVYSQKLKMII